MKKIAIMTWYKYMNYGTALQSSALFRKIEDLGYDCSMIDYSPKGDAVSDEKKTFNFVIHKIKSLLREKRNPSFFGDEIQEKFSEYIDLNLRETQRCNTYTELYSLNSQFDGFVCGSDQIWAPVCFDPHYFLDFVKNTKKMIAYAPSFGMPSINDKDAEFKIKGLVSRFEHLSVREKTGVDIVKGLCNKSVVNVLDPVFLFSDKEWLIKIGDDRVFKEDYIFCYFLGDDGKYKRYVENLSKIFGIPAYVVPVRKVNCFEPFPFSVGPKEFVSLIKNAKYVCTDSFHGMAFASIFNVAFSVFKRFKDNDPRNQNSRIIDFLDRVNLSSRLVSPEQNIEKDFLKCDFSEANFIIENERKKSIEYLEKALKEATSSTIDEKNMGDSISDLCCGCGACVAVCGCKAIDIKLTEEGFLKAEIDGLSCIKCGKCKSVCPFNKIDSRDMHNAVSLMAYKTNSKATLAVSSSGGFVHDAISYLNKNGYYVCGCEYDKVNNMAKHTIVEPKQEKLLSKFQGSKYLQSNMGECITAVCEIARDNKVVFVGTPCQVAGMDRALKNKGVRENAILIDLICHGVPSYNLWNKYLEEHSRKYGLGETPNVMFRNKKKGWRNLVIELYNDKFSKTHNEFLDNFYPFFKYGLCYMETCYDCPYRECSSADIRAGDYWGERFSSDKEGVSMVIANTFEGKALLENLICNSYGTASAYDKSEYWTVQYPYNPIRPNFRERLINDMKNDDVSLWELRKKYSLYIELREALFRMVRTIRGKMDK